MQTRLLVPVLLLCGRAAGLLAAQERLKPKGPADFETVHAAVLEHWKAERWGKSFASARELLSLISVRRARAIRAALPAAPAGYTLVPPDEEAEAQANPLLSTFAAGVGSIIEQTYSGAGKEIRVSVTADSPMLQMFNMMLQNPALLQPNQELIKYSECTAMLETQGDQVTLLIADSFVQANFWSQTSDFALKMFDQKAVTALHAVVSN
jgi:hypothetical protein